MDANKLWWLSLPVSGLDPLLAHMKAQGVELTRANYIERAGLVEPLDAEEEWMLPPEFSRVSAPE